MFIDGFGISEYRSFGRDIQRIGPLKQINFFIGQNNSGKSNILRFLKEHWPEIKSPDWAFAFSELYDRHKGKSSGQFVFEIGLEYEGESYKTLLKANDARIVPPGESLLTKILTSDVLTNGTSLAWFRFEGTWGTTIKMLQSANWLARIKSSNVLSHGEWNNLWSQLTGQQGGALEHWISQTLTFISPVKLGKSPVSFIPAFRKVDDRGQRVAGVFEGLGIVKELAQLQNPPHGKEVRKKQFRHINEFLQTVTGNETAQLEIPSEQDMILVHMDGKRLPLSSLGTGIHELVIIAAAATILSDQIVCVEEPEIHMHPTLQKQLVRYLAEKTNNQYFISTHSAHVLDTPKAAIFHVRLEDGQSTVESALSDVQKSDICADLGYRASDLLQANSVIWVEGPSDRVYLNHWISAEDPELIERVHYSIMFYGGRLLCHLSANDKDVEDFISLRRLNRHISIVIDSDLPAPRLRLNDTKRRVKHEFDKGPGFAWITKGREIENYIAPEVLESAIKKIHPTVTGLRNRGDYDKRLSNLKLKGQKRDLCPDKIRIAKEVARHEANFDVLDLKKQIKRLVQFIRHANDLQ